jgi:hypothetical protein
VPHTQYQDIVDPDLDMDLDLDLDLDLDGDYPVRHDFEEARAEEGHKLLLSTIRVIPETCRL